MENEDPLELGDTDYWVPGIQRHPRDMSQVSLNRCCFWSQDLHRCSQFGRGQPTAHWAKPWVPNNEKREMRNRIKSHLQNTLA